MEHRRISENTLAENIPFQECQDQLDESKYNAPIKQEKPVEVNDDKIKSITTEEDEVDESTYKLETFKYKYLVVFNQINVMKCKPRNGTEMDVKELINTFGEYGFEYHVHSDCTKAEILDVLKIFNEKDFTDYGCVAVVVLTHGTYNGMLGAKDAEYSEKEILNCFNTHDKPTLKSKPKLLIIQACRGNEPIEGVFAKHEGKILKNVPQDFNPYRRLNPDIFVFHSSYMGNPSHRCILSGSWFIQTLCQKIKQHSPSLDFESIATEVNNSVAINNTHITYDDKTKYKYRNKQMPMISSSLTRTLYLRKYDDNSHRK